MQFHKRRRRRAEEERGQTLRQQAGAAQGTEIRMLLSISVPPLNIACCCGLLNTVNFTPGRQQA